jgi:hypothetical protein
MAKWSVCLLSLLPFSIPAVGGTDYDWDWSRGPGLARLQSQLPAGRTYEFYREKLADLGYEITSVNYSDPDYMEYEVVRGDQTYEVQIEMDPDSGRATDIDVASNIWRTAATERMLDVNALKNELRDTTLADDADVVGRVRSYRFSDRDQARMPHLVKELEALPAGRERDFYRRALRQRGYRIIDTDSIGDRVQFEAVKDGQSIVLNVVLDPESGESTQVEAAPLWWDVAQERPPRGGEQEERPGAAERRGRSLDQASAKEEATQELEALPVGRERQFYRKALRQRGYQIPATYLDTDNQLQLEAVKDGWRTVMTVYFDDETGKSTEVYASPLGEQRQSTSRTQARAESQREANE